MAESAAEVRQPVFRSRFTTDMATVVGLVAGLGMLCLAILLEGAAFSAFFNPSAIMIVFGGTLCATTVCFSFGEMMRTLRVIMTTVFHKSRDAAEAAVHVLQIAELARKKGLLAVQEIPSDLQREPVLYKGIAMVVDGTPGEEVETILRRDVLATSQRHARSSSVLRKMSEFSPAMGLIGTLIGLVQMLGNLSDPSSIGPAMAVALLTTFYGAVLANMIFLPLASKLERNSVDETVINNIYMMGAASIGRQENPRRLEMLINSILPPAKRVRYFD